MPAAKVTALTVSDTISKTIAEELGVMVRQVQAAIDLLDEGATVPFIARYRKERTGGLDDTQLRNLAERYTYLSELASRRETVLASINEQGKLSRELQLKIERALTKIELEDLYRPYKPRRPDQLLSGVASPEKIASAFLNKALNVEDAEAALDGARDILIERMIDVPEVVQPVRILVWKEGSLSARLAKGKDEEAAKFRDYVDFAEPLEKMPSHRALAMLRGQKEGVLKVGSLAKIKAKSEKDAIQIFAQNLSDLLMAAPAGQKTVMGIDPGIRTGCKIAVVDPTGKLLDTATIYPHEPRRDWSGSLVTLAMLAKKHKVDLVSVGNGTASRETDKLIAELCDKQSALNLTKIIVSEAGASVYSASQLAADEFPNLDVSLRGAVSIARRLQDPLAELVKIEPKAIGVGQYQHDVDQSALVSAFSCVGA